MPTWFIFYDRKERSWLRVMDMKWTSKPMRMQQMINRKSRMNTDGFRPSPQLYPSFLICEKLLKDLIFSSWFIFCPKTEHMKQPSWIAAPSQFLFFVSLCSLFSVFCDFLVNSCGKQAQTITGISMDCVGKKVEVKSYSRCDEMLNLRRVIVPVSASVNFPSFCPFLKFILFCISTILITRMQ